MEITRNHYYVMGLVLLFFGIELRVVDSFVLTPELTNVLADRTGHPLAAVNSVAQTVFNTDRPLPITKTLQPPEWLGWALMSIGAVLTLHALSMPRPASG